jgi:hypothetical protein
VGPRAWTDAENLAPTGLDLRTVQPVAGPYPGPRPYHCIDLSIPSPEQSVAVGNVRTVPAIGLKPFPPTSLPNSLFTDHATERWIQCVSFIAVLSTAPVPLSGASIKDPAAIKSVVINR